MGNLVLMWPIWEYASPRPYPYGVAEFVAMTVLGVIYVTIMITIGGLFIRYAKNSGKRELNYLGYSILIVGICDVFHAIGDVLFYLTNDSRVPINLNGITLYYYPTATCLSTFGILLAYTLFYLFGAIQTKQQFTLFDRITIALGLIGIGFGINPYNWWHMVPPENSIVTIPITGIFLLVMGSLATGSLYRYYKLKLVPELKDELREQRRLRFVLLGVGFLGALVVLMILHAVFAVMEIKLLMLIVTYLKILSIIASVTFLYIGIASPKLIDFKI